jgi:hypothetical protein
MFEDDFGMATALSGDFKNSVRDSFGASLLDDVFDPVLHEIGALRSAEEDFQRQLSSISLMLEETRAIKGGVL